MCPRICNLVYVLPNNYMEWYFPRVREMSKSDDEKEARRNIYGILTHGLPARPTFRIMFLRVSFSSSHFDISQDAMLIYMS